MALKIDTKLKSGLDTTEGYFKVTNYSVSTINNIINFSGSLFLNQESRDSGLEPIVLSFLYDTINYEPTNQEILKMIYEHIKLQASLDNEKYLDFKNATDI